MQTTRVPFREEELEITGKYRPAPYGMLPGVPDWEYTYNRPVSPVENFKLAFSGQKPYWMPHVGWCDCDIKVFRPRIHVDNIWSHCLCDGEVTEGARYNWESNVGTGWFGLKWVFVPVAGGSTVMPGNPMIEDMNDWEEILQWPNLDELDFDDMAKKNEEFLGTGLANQLGVLNGFWERLISLMDVEGAAVALIDEDQKEAVKSFFDRYVDLLIDYVARVKKSCPNIHCVLLHDDWGHSTGAFFSLETCREMIVPYLRRLTDFVHSEGMFFELHSCGKGQTLVPAMIEAGIPSFKMYMTYPAMMIGDEDMFNALRKMKELGGIAGVHCENAGVIDALIAEKKAAGELSPSSHPLCRPSILEAEAVSRLLKMAEVADVPVVIVHLSSEAGLREVEAARARGQKVYVETCPHYLLLQDDLYSLPDFEGAKYICAPPLRKEEDNDALWAALANGAVQTISTDHCSFTLGQKDAGREDFTKIPGGMPGVETRGVLLYTYGVVTERITAERMVELLSTAPAKLYGAYPRKGQIAEGADADIVVYDPNGIRKISAKDQVCNVDYAPYEGYELSGHIAQVWLRGNLAVEDGNILSDHSGKYIPRGKCSL